MVPSAALADFLVRPAPGPATDRLAPVASVVGAFLAGGSAAFNWWVGWAAIAAFLVAVAMGLPALWSKIAGAPAALPDMRMTEGELAARVLAEARVARASLIGTDAPGDDAASVPFIRSGSRFREADGATPPPIPRPAYRVGPRAFPCPGPGGLDPVV